MACIRWALYTIELPNSTYRTRCCNSLIRLQARSIMAYHTYDWVNCLGLSLRDPNRSPLRYILLPSRESECSRPLYHDEQSYCYGCSSEPWGFQGLFEQKYALIICFCWRSHRRATFLRSILWLYTIFLGFRNISRSSKCLDDQVFWAVRAHRLR